VVKEADGLEKAFVNMVESNIFLQPYGDYPFVRSAFTNMRNEVGRRGF